MTAFCTHMSVSQRQMVEIAKAVSYDAKIIVLDEPTSSLTEREVSKLFSTLRWTAGKCAVKYANYPKFRSSCSPQEAMNRMNC